MTGSIESTRTVGQLVAERLGRSELFDRYGIDYCCGGSMSLKDACTAAGVDPEKILQELQAADADALDTEEIDCEAISMSDLVDHIMTTHHAYLREELPALAALLEKVENAHGQTHPEIHEYHQVFLSLRWELENHMAKEETILFPCIQQLEDAQTLPNFHCGTIQNPISAMEHEHNNAGQALKRIKELTNDFLPPEDVCATCRALLSRLERFEKDMFRHIHKENNVLFPRAAAKEESL
jgi:regulator of cell morphogenesis and NO signaling